MSKRYPKGTQKVPKRNPKWNKTRCRSNKMLLFLARVHESTIATTNTPWTKMRAFCPARRHHFVVNPSQSPWIHDCHKGVHAHIPTRAYMNPWIPQGRQCTNPHKGVNVGIRDSGFRGIRDSWIYGLRVSGIQRPPTESNNKQHQTHTFIDELTTDP